MTLIQLAALFTEQKTWLVATTALGRDALHVYFGLSVFMAVRLLWRRPGGGPAAWLGVLVLAVIGEWLDMTTQANNAMVLPLAAHWHDIWNTMFWPTVLLFVGHWLQPKAGPASEASGEDAERRLEQA